MCLPARSSGASRKHDCEPHGQSEHRRWRELYAVAAEHATSGHAAQRRRQSKAVLGMRGALCVRPRTADCQSA